MLRKIKGGPPAQLRIEEHQRALKPEDSHRTATGSDEISADDKTDPVN
jgi:hypothetical protein